MKRWISILVICSLALQGAAVRAEEPARYAAVETVDGTRMLSGSFISVGAAESAICVTGGTLLLRDASIVRSCDEDADPGASLYGVGAAVLAAGGALDVRNSAIDTDAAGAAGLFSGVNGEITAENLTIDTAGDGAAGVAAVSGGALRAEKLRVTTGGCAAPAIRVGPGGSAAVQGGSYQTAGADSPAVHASAEAQLREATLGASASEALRVDGGGNLLLVNCSVSGGSASAEQRALPAVLVCADEEGVGRLELSGGTLASSGDRLFCIEGSAGDIVLCGVELDADSGACLLDCTRGLRRTGGAVSRFTAIGQAMSGDVRWSAASGLDFYVSEGSRLCGAVYVGADGGSGGYCSLYIDASSEWTVTADSALTNLSCAGRIVDEAGRSVTIVGTDGTLFVQGEGARTVTVERYSSECDMSGAGRRTDGMA